MYDGYLVVGGVEVINNERVRGYARTIDCPFRFKDEPCETLEAAIAAITDPEPQGTYDYGDITNSPWYDWTVPDASSRFLGVYATRMKGLLSSTREAQVVQAIGDGGFIGAQRRATRETRFNAILLAQGTDALEYGLRWLDAVLDPGACGRHAETCGTTDMTYLTTCPPALEDFEGGTTQPQPPLEQWNVVATNLWTNPRATATGVGTWGAPTNGAASYVTTFPGDVATARRFTASSIAGVGRLHSPVLGPAMPANGVPVRVLVTVNASEPFTGTFIAVRPTVTAATNEVRLTMSLPGVTIPAGVSTIEAWGNSFPVAAGANSGVVLAAIPGTIGATLDITKIVVEGATGPGAVYYDGETPDTETDRYQWTAAVDGSTSTREHLTLVDQPPIFVPDYPDPVAAYSDALDGIQRYLHGVATVSGPNEGNQIELDRGFWALDVEFVIVAGRPFVYSVTVPVALPTTPSTVVDDVPKNLIPYPSAELSGAVGVVVARNYAPNPSVETNATGWTTAGDGAVILNANVVGARDTGLAAVGAASYRSVFTAPAASAVEGSFRIDLTVPLPHAVVAGERYSVNMWSSKSIAAGAPVFGVHEIRAYWQDAASATLRTDTIGTVPELGGAVSLKSIEPPVGATKVIVRAILYLTSWNAGTIVRLYADATAVTVP